MGEVEEARKLLWEWLKGRQTGVRQAAPTTWKDGAWPDWPGPGGKKYGSCKSEGAAHQPAAWYLRGLPTLKSVFSEVAVEEGWCYSHRPWQANGTKGQLSQRGRSTFIPAELTEEQKQLI